MVLLFMRSCFCFRERTWLYTPISENVVGENGEWQLSNGNCTTAKNCGFHIWYAKTIGSLRGAKLGSSSNHDDDGNKNHTNLHIGQWKTVFLHALHVHFSSFHILKTFSFFQWREMTFFAVVWTTWREHMMTNVQFCPVPSAGSNLIPG